MESLNWELLKSFLAVVRGGSLSAAARELRSTQPTIGRHIKILESTLDRALFVRSREGLEPTPEALELLPSVEAMAQAQHNVMRALSGEGGAPSGTVRLSVSEVVGVEILPPILAKFRRTYPEISIELVLSNRVENLLKREADLAVRMVQPTQAALIARKIGDSPIGLYAHRAYLAEFGTPGTLADLVSHSGIGPDEDALVFQHMAAHGIPLASRDFALRTDNQIAQLALLRAGAGIGGAQVVLAKKDPNMVRILENEFQVPMEVWLVTHEDLKATKRIRALFDFLHQELTDFFMG